VLSEGRAWLGIGTASFEGEARGLGLPFPPARQRFERLEPVGAADRSSDPAAIMLPVTGGGPHGHGRSESPGPARVAPHVLLGQQVIGVGFDEQLYEYGVHDVPPGPAAATLVGAPLLLSSGIWVIRYGGLNQE
jgi:hypothetical protein